jgi:pilus assembly protein CpaC
MSLGGVQVRAGVLRVLLGAAVAASAVSLYPSLAEAQKGANVETIDLVIGEQRTLSADNVRSYSEGVRGIVDIRLTKEADQFVIVGTAAGETTLLTLMMDGSQKTFKFNVTDPNAKRGDTKVVPRNPNAVDAKDSIRLDFYFVQLDRTYNHTLGMRWPSQFFPGSTLGVTLDLSSGALRAAPIAASQLLPSLDLAQATGTAKLMRHATVITANRSKAHFAGGAEVNVKVAGGLTTGVQSIAYGSKIAVQPNYDASSGRIELTIDADVSDLTPDGGTGAPGRTTSTVSSLVNLELGQSVMLGGLVSEAAQKSKSGFPGLSQIPILGLLFGTHTSLASDTESVVFIVPSVVDAASLDARARIKDALEAFQNYSGDLEKVDFIPQPGSSGKRAPAKKE